MNSPPKWFKVIAVVALLWNLLGCFAFVSDLRLSPEDVAHLSKAQQALYNARPGWAVASTALAVLGGALGCIGLLLSKSWALPLFIVSLVGIRQVVLAVNKMDLVGVDQSVFDNIAHDFAALHDKLGSMTVTATR